MNRLAIIIINHLHGDLFQKTMESLSTLDGDYQTDIFVIQNLPDPPVKDWVEQNFPQTHLIENESPKGFAANINQVLRNHTDFDGYFLLNPDVICLPGMLSNLIGAMALNPQIGVAAPQLLNPDGSIQPSRRRFAPFLALALRALHLDKILPHLKVINRYLMTDITFEGVTEVDWVTGAAMLLRKTALDQVGLLDERFFLYFEDEDLCCRMWQKDWKVCYVPQAQAYHKHIARGRNIIFSKENFHQLLSAVKMLFKYHGNITRCYHKKHLKG